MAPLPTTAASAALGCIGFMNAAFGLRFAPPFFFALPRFADFFAPLLAPRFFPFFAAILSPGRWNGTSIRRKTTRFPYENHVVSEENTTILALARNREGRLFLYE